MSRLFVALSFILVSASLWPIPANADTQGTCTVDYTLTFTPALKATLSTTQVDIQGGGSCVLDDGTGMVPTQSHDVTIDATTNTVQVAATCADLVTMSHTATITFDNPPGPSVPANPLTTYVGSVFGGTLTIEKDGFAGHGHLALNPLGTPLGIANCNPMTAGVSTLGYKGTFVVDAP